MNQSFRNAKRKAYRGFNQLGAEHPATSKRGRVYQASLQPDAGYYLEGHPLRQFTISS